MRKLLAVAVTAPAVAATLAGGANPAAAAATHCDANAFCVYEGNDYTGTRHILPPGVPYKDIGAARTIRSISNNSNRHVCVIKWDGGRRINSTVNDYWETNNLGHYGLTGDAIGEKCW